VCGQQAVFRIKEMFYTGRWTEQLACFMCAHRMLDDWIYEVVPPNVRVIELLD